MVLKTKIIIAILILSCFTPLQAQTQKGKASFYSRRATGARTANGERLHHDSLTCAHRTYPFGTRLLVTNPANGKQVVVRVTDRGPFVRGRIIDLSVRAARELGMISAGIAVVTVQPYKQAVGIPFRPEDDDVQLPELDFEMAEAGYSFIPEWQARDETPAAAEKELPKRILKNNQAPNSTTSKSVLQPATAQTNEPTDDDAQQMPAAALKRQAATGGQPKPAATKQTVVRQKAEVKPRTEAKPKAEAEKNTQESSSWNIFEHLKKWGLGKGK